MSLDHILKKAEVSGVGTVGKPTTTGKFVADVLDMLLPPNVDRRKYKLWLAAHLVFYLQKTSFLLGDRQKFVLETIEEFRAPQIFKTKLLQRLNRYIVEMEMEGLDGPRLR